MSRVFEYDESYGDPWNKSNAIWRSLIPRHGGFFNHPTIAPDRSVFSVFHQLHCLDGMRRGYWAFYNAMNEQVVLEEENMQPLLTPMHFKHCVDYLRQGLMCRPDLTLEILNPAGMGVEGFGTEHTCKNWGELTTFVKAWETWGRD
ncbi:hypothetical protein BDV96DRAFT_647539 [Lophiotrema nucula]|uniref:Oxidase ustYa n=1 Tax=Lophiotrema nucula TaxID=690887 RepID=A0A6A5Z3R3_9PLEO|nr:hypothetical protein BDV96DRAFT_647539 [Lophiotrema nucula]